MAVYDVGALVEELRWTRQALLGALDSLSETRIYRATERAGWTIKHELATVAADDSVLVHALEELSRRPALESVDVRRLRGETMLAAKDLRLSALRDRIESGVHHLVEAVERHEHALARPVSFAGRPVAAAAALIAEHAERTRDCQRRVEAALS
jgi:hypothetical protein